MIYLKAYKIILKNKKFKSSNLKFNFLKKKIYF
jgi:hypothetical protein